MRQLGTIFSKPKYILIATVVSWVVFTLSVWLPNIKLIGVVLASSATPLVFKLQFLWSLYGAIGTNFTTISATYTIAIAILFGINIALLAYYIQRVGGGVRTLAMTSTSGLGGLVSGIFGIGCAACGTFILTSALALFGAGGIVAFLPFGGEEFGFLGVALLCYSIFSLLKKIKAPMVCPV